MNINREGEIFTTKWGEQVTIIKYVNNKEVYASFDNGQHLIKCYYKQLTAGTLTNPLRPTVYGVGYCGYGDYKCKEKGNDYINQRYETWCSMFVRCYGSVTKKNRPTYDKITVCDEWHNFQIFARWYDDNYYEVEGESMCLDKDIIVKGSITYSPETCVFVPRRINVLFTKSDGARSEYPIGVHRRKDTGKFASHCSVFREGSKKQYYIGQFDSPDKAFQAYKEFKESYIKEVANEYKDRIPKKLYEAMYSYEVEITD